MPLCAITIKLALGLPSFLMCGMILSLPVVCFIDSFPFPTLFDTISLPVSLLFLKLLSHLILIPFSNIFKNSMKLFNLNTSMAGTLGPSHVLKLNLLLVPSKLLLFPSFQKQIQPNFISFKISPFLILPKAKFLLLTITLILMISLALGAHLMLMLLLSSFPGYLLARKERFMIFQRHIGGFLLLPTNGRAWLLAFLMTNLRLILRHDTSTSADNSYSCPRVVGSPKPLLVLSEARGNMYPQILMGNLWISTSRHRTYK